MTSVSDDDNVIHVEFGAPEPPPQEPREPPSEENLEKLEIFTELVDRGTVMVTLDARRDDVVVPSRFSDELRLNLNFCHMFRIPDFEYDEWGVRASLSFSGVDHYCDIPWEAVYMMRSHVENEVMLFPTAVPPEMVAFMRPPDSSDEEE